MKRRPKWSTVTIALAVIAAVAVASPALGGPSLRSLVKKEVTKQISKATGPAGPAGTNGTNGVNGTGAAAVAVRVGNTIDESIPNNVVTPLTFDTEHLDTVGLHSTATNTDRLVAPVTGVYAVSGEINWEPAATGDRLARIVVSGVTFSAQDSRPHNATGSGGNDWNSISTVVALDAGDYVTLNAYQDSGAPLDVDANVSASPQFSMYLVGT